MTRLLALGLLIVALARMDSTIVIVRHAATTTTSSTTSSTSTVVTTSTTSSTAAGTTSTTASTTTTTATTTSTSTTTIGPSTSFAYVFGEIPDAWGTTAISNSTNALRCFDFVATLGITSATQFVVENASGTNSAITIGLWDATGTTLKATSGVQNWSGSGAVRNVTGLSAFSLVQGTVYRLCWCENGTTGSWRTQTQPTASPADSWQNAFGVKHMGTGGNSCTAGAFPGSTGALTGAAFGVPAMELGTNSP